MSKANAARTRPTAEDDLDDLDDVLNDFSAASKQPSQPDTPGTSKAHATDPQVPPNTAMPGIDDLEIGNDFARELAAGMASLMREIAAESVKDGGASEGEGALGSEEEKRREAAFRKAWEDMLVEGMNGALDTDDFGGKGKAPAKPGETPKADVDDDAFQSSIRKAMDKLKVSEPNQETQPTTEENDAFEKLLAHLGDGGAESEEELQGLLETMMTQLMSKDVLYEPLKELHEKFPTYLKDNAATLKPEEKERYEAQNKIVGEIVAIFDDPSYSPEDQEKGVKIVTLMNTMQSHGSPPAEIMGPLPPGLDLGPDGLPKLPEGCSIQ